MSFCDLVHKRAGPKVLSETIYSLTSSGQCRWTSRPGFLVVRASNVVSMEKLPLLVHGKPNMDLDVGAVHPLPMPPNRS